MMGYIEIHAEDLEFDRFYSTIWKRRLLRLERGSKSESIRLYNRLVLETDQFVCQGGGSEGVSLKKKEKKNKFKEKNQFRGFVQSCIRSKGAPVERTCRARISGA